MLLFGDAGVAERGAAEEVGELLRALDLAQNTHVQVTYDENMSDFVFPWTLLYPPEEIDTVDPDRFWGARFQIEQVWHGRSSNDLDSEPVNLSLAIDPRFDQANAEDEMFNDLVSRSAGRLTLTTTARDKTSLLISMLKDPASHLYYFFCHGYAPAGPSILQPDGVQQLTKLITETPPETQTAWQTLLTLTARMKDEAWIFLGNGEITESALRLPTRYFLSRRPVVFMNMCHSAALMPSMTSGLVRLFLSRSASAVIGTEAPMTSVFAHAFAEQFFANLLDNCDVGSALLRARRYFLNAERRNPLGLAYSLYGRATIRIGKSSIIPLQSQPPQAATAGG
jgi:hypothetical protein